MDQMTYAEAVLSIAAALGALSLVGLVGLAFAILYSPVWPDEQDEPVNVGFDHRRAEDAEFFREHRD